MFDHRPTAWWPSLGPAVTFQPPGSDHLQRENPMTRTQLTVDELLTTTRAVRKRLDLERPVSRELLEECLELALQAPSGSNAQGWQFVFVTDREKRRVIGELYAKSFDAYRNASFSAHALADAQPEDSARAQQMERVVSSAEHLAEVMGQVPVHFIPCISGRVDELSGPGANAARSGFYGSILPATWSFMLAARSRGLGTAWTTLHLTYEKEVAELLGIPYESVTQTALIPVAHYTGESFKPALRKPLDEVLHWDTW